MLLSEGKVEEDRWWWQQGWRCTPSKVDWSQYIAVNSATAHPHYDRDGATYNMGNSHNKSGNLPCPLVSYLPKYTWLHLCDYVYAIHPHKYCTTSFVLGPPQVSSTTSSVCLLLSSRHQRRTQTWPELKWSAQFVHVNPGNLPTIIALVRSIPQCNKQTAASLGSLTLHAILA